MVALSYEAACRDTAMLLGLDDPEALGLGEAFLVDDVQMELARADGERRPEYLIVEIGMPARDQREAVFEQLLTMHVFMMGTSDGMFAYDRSSDRVIFCVPLWLGDAFDAQALANALKGMSRQAIEWRETMLAGKLVDFSQNDGFGAADAHAERVLA